MDTVVDAFVWPLRLLGIASPAEGELDHVPLLSLPHNAIVNHLLPALCKKERARLSLTCKTLWQLVAATVISLAFDGEGTLCMASKSPWLLHFTNVTSIRITLHGWHDIGFGAPQLLLHLSKGLPKISEVNLVDRSHEDMYEPLHSPLAGMASSAWNAAAGAAAAVGLGNSINAADGDCICDGCGFDPDLPDLSCVLMSLLALYPGLKKLELYTKRLSEAELATLSRLPQLTSLTLNSEDGVVPGALCNLSQLKSLQELRLGDVDGNNPEDVDTVCDMVTRLTSLHMGYCPRLQPPVLRQLHQVQSAVKQYILEQQQEAEAAHRQRRQRPSGIVTRSLQAATSVAGAAAHAVLGNGTRSNGSNNRDAARQTGMWQSEQMLLDAGVPREVLGDQHGVSGTGGGQRGCAMAAPSLAAAAAAAPKPEGSISYQQQEQEHQQNQQPDTHVNEVSTAAGATGSTVQGHASGVSSVADNTSATASSFTPAGSYISSSCNYNHQTNSTGSSKPTFRLVTELSVNIDAEEGQEILYEMSQLSLLESLLVDSTDEFEFDPGFQPFSHTTNLRRLAITMPMSLVNTQSLSRCKQLRDLLLCALPTEVLDRGSLEQVTRLELLDVAANPPNPELLQAFPAVAHLVIRHGANDTTLGMIGRCMTSLVHLELYNLPAGYSQEGLRGIAQLTSLKTLILQLASPGKALGTRTQTQINTTSPLLLPLSMVTEIGSELSAAAGSMGVPLLGTNPILAFAPPGNWGLLNRLHLFPDSNILTWFPNLKELSLLGYVSAADQDLHALSHLRSLHTLNMHLQKPRGFAGRVTLRGLWELVEMNPTLSAINLTGYMETQLLVPGRVPGVGL